VTVALDDDAATAVCRREFAPQFPAFERAKLLTGKIFETLPAQPGLPPI
jgi:hypothetical protein